MGTVRVRVGCPHRLRQPITRLTGTPCRLCEVFRVPGWPREAWAMTVDHGPRLSEAATTAPVPVPPPTKVEMPPAVAAAFAAVQHAADAMREGMAPVQRALNDLAARGIVMQVTTGDLHVRTARSDSADVFRTIAEREYQIRMSRARDQ